MNSKVRKLERRSGSEFSSSRKMEWKDSDFSYMMVIIEDVRGKDGIQ